MTGEDLAVVLSAAVVGGSLRSQMRDFEQVAVPRLRRWSLGHAAFVALLALALLLLAGALAGGDGRLGAGELIWDLALFLQVAALSGLLLGVERAWLLPLLAVVPLTMLDPLPGGHHSWWSWVARLHGNEDVVPAQAALAVLLAVVLLLRATVGRRPWVRRLLLAGRRPTGR